MIDGEGKERSEEIRIQNQKDDKKIKNTNEEGKQDKEYKRQINK